MAQAGWVDFIAWARRARAKPSFDVEEREYRLAIAGAGRELIEAARDGRPLAAPAGAITMRLVDRFEPPLPPRQAARLSEWAAADEQDLARVLRELDDANDPVEGHAGFLEAAARGRVAGRFADGGLAVASLLNFAKSPARLPIVNPRTWGPLEELLDGGAADGYGSHLAFARRVEDELRAAGVPVRDMVDVESLIAICSAQYDLWTTEDGDAADPRREREPEVRLAACMMYRNEADHLAEWIEFHRLVGVERFYLYDNESDDRHREVLARYIDEGAVVLHEWSGAIAGQADLNAVQIAAYEHCVATHGGEARWIAFLDADEFLFAPDGRPVPEVLADYERWPAVAVNTPRFGTSGHATRPTGLVTEIYTKRIDTDGPCFVKSVVDPTAVTGAFGAHRFRPRRGATVDENGYPVYGNRTRVPSFAKLRINHYFARSEADLRAKLGRRVADRRWEETEQPPAEDLLREAAGGVRDETILRYLPRLHEALRRRDPHL